MASVFEFIYSCLKRALFWQTTLFGIVTTGLAAVSAFIATVFSRFTWLNTIVGWINTATSNVSSLVNSDSTAIGRILFDWIAVDVFVQVFSVVASVTIGVALLVFISVFTSVFALVPVTLCVRAVCKAVRVGTLGVAEP